MDNAVSKIETAAVAPVGESAALLQVIERAAQNPDVDIEKMERLLQMHERIQGKQAEAAFSGAMKAAQSEMRHVAADASNPQTKSKYASYAALDKALRPIYTRHGFAISFDTGPADEGYTTVLAYVSHEAGHTRTHRAIMPSDGKGAKGGDVMTKTHATGAAMSYGMRYLLKMIFNVAIGDDDNDGNTGEVISQDQADDLRALAEEVGADKGKFLRYMGVEYFENIRDYERARSALEAKRLK